MVQHNISLYPAKLYAFLTVFSFIPNCRTNLKLDQLYIVSTHQIDSIPNGYYTFECFLPYHIVLLLIANSDFFICVVGLTALGRLAMLKVHWLDAGNKLLRACYPLFKFLWKWCLCKASCLFLASFSLCSSPMDSYLCFMWFIVFLVPGSVSYTNDASFIMLMNLLAYYSWYCCPKLIYDSWCISVRIAICIYARIRLRALVVFFTCHFYCQRDPREQVH